MIICIPNQKFDYLHTILFEGTIDNPDEDRNAEAAQSLLVITFSPPYSSDYAKFQLAVNAYNEKEPFKFPNPFGVKKKVNIELQISIIKKYKDGCCYYLERKLPSDDLE